MEGKKKSNATISIIGWVLIIHSAIVILISIVGLIAYFSLKSYFGPMPDEIPNIIKSVLSYFPYDCASQIIFGIVIIFVSISFMKLRPWSRWAVIIISWINIFVFIGVGAVFIMFIDALKSSIVPPPASSVVLVIVLSVALTIICVIPFALIIIALHKTKNIMFFKKEIAI